MIAADVMRTNVVSVRPDTLVSDAIQLMLDRGVFGLPVLDEAGQLIGIVTEGDFLRRAELGTQPRRTRWLEMLRPGRAADDYIRSHGRRVEEIMTSPVITISEHEPLESVVALMEQRLVKRLPVVRDGKLIGLVSRKDLLRALAKRLAAPIEPCDDQAIRDRLGGALKELSWVPATVRFTVLEGTVEYQGVIFDQKHRVALRVMAENIPGVRRVHDLLTWIDPVSGMTILGPEGTIEGGTAT